MTTPLSDVLPVVEDALDNALLTMAWDLGEPLRAVESLRPWQDFSGSIEEIERYEADRYGPEVSRRIRLCRRRNARERKAIARRHRRFPASWRRVAFRLRHGALLKLGEGLVRAIVGSFGAPKRDGSS